ncbi:MAG: TonB family protein [Vicinamibacterales bacterium]
MIHFNLDDRIQDENVVGSAISRREGVLMSVVGHALFLALLLFAPSLDLFELSPEELERQEELAQQQPDEDNPTMVFVQPRVDMPAEQPPDRAELSDLDRRAQAPEVSLNPTNPLPSMRGNSAERNEAVLEERERARGAESPEPPLEQPQPESTEARILPPANEGILLPRERDRQTPPARGALGDALRNLERYIQNQTFDNPQGGERDPGATIQFDTKGVEFGPWLRRFVARVRRNWFIPLSAMTMRGHVVIQFNIWKNGTITDVNIVQPAALDSFNNAAYNAIVSSSPVDPLPPEYPSEKAFFTVTFYYNERPPLN